MAPRAGFTVTILKHNNEWCGAFGMAGKKVTVCGEYAASLEGARTLIGLGVDALSVPPPRFAPLKIALGEWCFSTIPSR